MLHILTRRALCVGVSLLALSSGSVHASSKIHMRPIPDGHANSGHVSSPASVRRPQAESKPENESRQSPTSPSQGLHQEEHRPEFILVNGKRQIATAYLTPADTTALKIPVQIQKTPLSVQVVTHALIQDRGALTINQAVETVSGVERNLTFPNSLTFRVRGFSDSSTTLRDGFREQTGTQDIQGVESIEVLKGPASVLYGGSLSSGGVVNVKTKRPVDGANFLNAGLSGGSFGLFRGIADANRDLSGDGTLVGRLNLAYQHDNTFRNFGYNEDTYIAPTIRWCPSRHDTVTFFSSYQLSNYT